MVDMLQTILSSKTYLIINMAQYIIVGGGSLLGVDVDGNYRLLTAPMGSAERLAEMGPDALKGGAPRVVSNEMDKGFKYVDVENMEPAERGRLLELAESKGGGQMAFTTKGEHSNKITKFVDVLKKIKAGIGGKLPGILGILDIMGMKKEYDQIMAGEHPYAPKLFYTEEEFKEKFGNQIYADGGYVTSPFVKDIFDN